MAPTGLTLKAVNKWQRPVPCWCGGYWFPHRKGSGACEHNGVQGVRMLLERQGLDKEQVLEAMIDYALNNPGKPGDKCPF